VASFQSFEALPTTGKPDSPLPVYYANGVWFWLRAVRQLKNEMQKSKKGRWSYEQ